MRPASVGTNAVDRSLRKLAIDTPVNLEKRRAALGYDALGEIENQFQVRFSGTAGTAIEWAYVPVDFNVEFWFAPEQRDSPLTVPQFLYGVVISDSQENDSPADPPLVVAQVTDWTIDDRGAYVGATVGLTAYVQAGSVDFAALVHLSFQGYGAPSEDDVSTVATDGGSQ